MRGHSWIRQVVVSFFLAAAAASAASVATAASRSTTPTQSVGPGIWLVTAAGHIAALGGAPALTTTDPGWPRRHRIVAAAPTPTGAGLWLAASDGRVYAFGDADSFVQVSWQHRFARAAAIAATPSGNGYLVAFDDGTVKAYGDAVVRGSADLPRGNRHEIVGLAVTPTGGGYWLVGTDGRVYAFGDATPVGSATDDIGGHRRVVGVASTPTGLGLWLAAADGRIVTLGDAESFLSSSGSVWPRNVVAIASTPTARGLWLARASGSVVVRGDAGSVGRTYSLGGVVAVAASFPTGKLTVDVPNLPEGTLAAATVTGPSGSFDIRATRTLRVAPGDYAVVAASVHLGDKTYYPTISGSPASVEPGGAATATVDYLTSVFDSTKVVPEAAVASATGDPATGVTLTLDAAEAPDVQVGDIVALGVTEATPYGLLGRVMAVSSLAGVVTLETTPAAVNEAVASGELDIDAAPTQPVQSRAQRSSSVEIGIAETIGCGLDDPITVSGGVDLSFDPDFYAKWGGISDPKSFRARASATVVETARLAMSAKTAVECELASTGVGPSVEQVFEVPVGPVVIPVVARAQLVISGSGRFEAPVAVDVRQQITATFGATYDDGEFDGISDVRHEFDADRRPAPIDNGEVEVTVGPKISLLVAGRAGPEAYMVGGLEFKADELVEPPTPWWTLDAVLEAGIDFKVTLVDIWIVDLEFEKKLKLYSRSWNLARATDRPPAIVEVDPASAKPGEMVTVSGRRFGENEIVVIGFREGPRLGAVTTDTGGTFSQAVQIPNDVVDGERKIGATGQRTDRQGIVDFYVEPLTAPELSVNPSSVAPGESADVSGTGFRPGENIELDLDGEAVGTAIADDDGSFARTVEIPSDVAEGHHTIVARGRSSGRRASASVAIAKWASVSVDPSEARTGYTVIIHGDHFASGEIVELMLEPSGRMLGVATVFLGSFSAAVELPAVRPGLYSIVATGLESGIAASGELTILARQAQLTADPTEVPKGRATVLSGAGFDPGERVELYYDDRPDPFESEDADESGAFVDDEPDIPWDSAPGEHVITAIGDVSGAHAEVVVTITPRVDAVLSATPQMAEQGQETTVWVSGEGFVPNELVEVVFEFGPPTQVVTADDEGSIWPEAVTMSADLPSGWHRIVATGRTSGRTAETAVWLNAPPLPSNRGGILAGAGGAFVGSSGLSFPVPLVGPLEARGTAFQLDSSGLRINANTSLPTRLAWDVTLHVTAVPPDCGYVDATVSAYVDLGLDNALRICEPGDYRRAGTWYDYYFYPWAPYAYLIVAASDGVVFTVEGERALSISTDP